jgi:hypothetical protein
MHPGTAATPTTSTPTGDPTDIAAAIAAVRRLYAEYNAMLASGSSELYRKTFTKACSYCLGNANRVDRIHQRRQHVEGGAVKLSRLRVADVQRQFVVVEGTMTDSPVVVKDGDRVVDRFAGGTSVRFTWTVEPAGGGWLVSNEQVPR